MHDEAQDPLLHEEQFVHTVDPEADLVVICDQESEKPEILDVYGRESSL
jgi:hypothetical protein